MNIKQKIREALQGQTTGLVSAEIRERAKIDSASGCSLALRQMKVSGELVAHAGDSPRKTRYTLNPHWDGDPAAQGGEPSPRARKKRGRKKSHGGGQARKVRREEPAAAPEFTPALTVEHELVCLTHDGAAPVMFTSEQTIAIATLLAANFR